MTDNPHQPDRFAPRWRGHEPWQKESSETIRQRIYAHCKASGTMRAYYDSYPDQAPPGYFDRQEGRGRGGR